MNYSFDPLKYGFEPIQKYPELSYNFPMIDGYYVKIVSYSNYGDLVYWYKIISTLIGLSPDDRVKIQNGSYDFRRPCEYEDQNKTYTEYLGLISTDDFAKNLLTHLLGTTKNESLNDVAIERYNENLGLKMRIEFPQYYRKEIK